MTTFTEIAKLDAPVGGEFAFTGLTLTGYSKVQVVGSGVTVSADDTEAQVRLYVSGSEISTSSYRWGTFSTTSGVGGNGDGSVGTNTIMLLNSNDANWGTGNDTGEGMAFVATIDQPTSTALYKKMGGEAVATGPTGVLLPTGSGGMLQDASAIDGIKIFLASGSFGAGKVRLLGLA